MKSTAKILAYILFITFLAVFWDGCSQDNLTTPCPADGAFVVLSDTFNATVQTNPENDSLLCLLTFSFNYHFENVKGNILSRTLRVKDYHWDRLFLTPHGAENPNSPKNWEEDLWLKEDMLGIDSLAIEVIFYTVLAVETECIESYEWMHSVTIPIERK